MTASALGAMRIDELVRLARERGASDIHLAPPEVPMLRVDGDLISSERMGLEQTELDAFVDERLDSRAKAALACAGYCDAAVHVEALGSLRLHVFRSISGLRCAIRLLPRKIPPLDSLDVPRTIERLVQRKSGLILIVGPTGSGKTTMLAAMIDHLNRTNARHVVMLEDPVEYVHQSDRCMIAQCEIGRDANDLATAISATLRADPDVIVIGELRDSGAMRSALTAAETGHLVIASLHTLGAVGAVERIVDAFPVEGRNQVRIQLAQSLAGIVALRLVARARGGGRRAVAEILIASDAVRNLIREGKTHQLQSAIQTGRGAGMQTLEMHLTALADRGEITRDVAMTCADV